MTFSKTFPRNVPGSNYPVWEEVKLTTEEEEQAEQECKRENDLILDQAITRAKQIAIKHGINQDHIISKLAVALFEKEASHVVFWKEKKAKEKFDLKV